MDDKTYDDSQPVVTLYTDGKGRWLERFTKEDTEKKLDNVRRKMLGPSERGENK